MGLNDIALQISDSYDRKARLWPALLAMLPLIAMFALLYVPGLTVFTNAVLLAASCGAFYLLTNISRESGKRLESKLYESWGGKPTTLLLRHRDMSIESVTKHRYHSFLSGKINVTFPSAEDEALDPKTADETYQSGVRWLLNHGQKGLALKENIVYGFRRNALAIKPAGLMFSVCALIWVLATHRILSISSRFLVDRAALAQLPATAAVSLIISVTMLIAWMLFFTRISVKTAAFTYAETLLRSCDMLDDKQPT